MATYLGFYLGHDSNVAIAIDGHIKYRKSERHYGIKHHKATLDFVYSTLKDWGIKKVDYVCYKDGNRNNLGECKKDELFCKGILDNSFCIDHHYAHMLSLFPIVDKLDFGIVIDGRGDHYRSGTIIESPYENPKIIETIPYPHIGYEFYKVGKSYGFSGLEYDI